jgi:arylsulfatase A-like enzyme
MRFKSRRNMGWQGGAVVCWLGQILFGASLIADPQNVIIAIIDDVSPDELPTYNGYPLAGVCGECPTDCGTPCPTCSCSVDPSAFTYPSTPFVTDVLAAEGVVFRKAYANTVCSPTRSTMQTGRYGFRTGVGSAAALHPRERTIPEILATAAPTYATAAIGKWHLTNNLGCGTCGPALTAGYQYFAGSPGPYLEDYCSWNKVVIDAAPTFPATNCPSSTRKIYATTDTADDAIRWLCQLSCGDGYCSPAEAAAGNCADCPTFVPPQCGNSTCEAGESHCICPQDCPVSFAPPSGCDLRNNFFLWLGFNAPHAPFEIPQSFCDAHGLACEQVGSTSCSVICDSTLGCPSSPGEPPPLDTRATIERMLQIESCELERVYRLIENANPDETTYFLIGDNGSVAPPDGHWPNGHVKGTVYEGGVRVPLIVKGPTVESGQSGARFSDILVNTVDIFSTALELMGVSVSTAAAGVTLDSVSFLPVLEDDANEATHPRDFIYVEDFARTCGGIWKRAIRDDQYKLYQECSACTDESCCYSTKSCTEKWYRVSDVLECCNLEPAPPIGVSEAIDALRNKLPEDVLCHDNNGCKSCCEETDCCHNPDPSTCPPGTACTHCGTLTCDATTHECCGAPDLEGIKVEWPGLPGTPQINEDYSVYSSAEGGACAPHVVLRTTLHANGFPVSQYRVTRFDDQGDTLPLSAVTTDWPIYEPGRGDNVRVEVGIAGIPQPSIGDVGTVNIARESSSTWSSIIFGIDGDVARGAKASPSIDSEGNPLAGGRIRGDVDGTIKDINAVEIGEGASAGGVLKTGGLDATASIKLEAHPTTSTLRLSGEAETIATIIVGDSDGFDGPVIITDEFNGKLCANGLDLTDLPPDCNPLNNPQCVHSTFDVAFGQTGQICSDPGCTTCETPCGLSILPPVPEPAGIEKNRYISFILQNDSSGAEYALRVMFDSLHRPIAPANAPDFTAHEGEVRYVQGPIGTCIDSVAQGTSFKCAKLGCAPSDLDWDAQLDGAVLHVTGPEVVPSSRYIVQVFYDSSSGYDCRSGGLAITTARWGNVDNSAVTTPNAIDISEVVDAVKDAPGRISNTRAQLQPHDLNPLARATAQDIGKAVDAVKGKPYTFTGPAPCP